jgi:hypothetical protein
VGLTSAAEVVAMLVAGDHQALGWVVHDNPTDFDIENIDLWRQGSEEVPPASPAIIGAWVNLVEADGIDPSLDPFVQRIADVFVAQFGIGQAQAVALADAFLHDALTEEQARTLGNQASVLASDLAPILVDLRASLAALEQQHGTLRAAYRGHPEVTTTVTVTSLLSGSYRARYFDDATGELVAEELVSGPSPVLSVPPFRKHLAFVVEPIDAS